MGEFGQRKGLQREMIPPESKWVKWRGSLLWANQVTSRSVAAQNTSLAKSPKGPEWSPEACCSCGSPQARHLREAAQFQNLSTTSPEALIINCGDRSVTPCSSFHLYCLGGGRNASDGPNHTVPSNLRGPESGRPIPLATVWGPGFHLSVLQLSQIACPSAQPEWKARQTLSLGLSRLH